MAELISNIGWFNYMLDRKTLGDINYGYVTESVNIVKLYKDNFKTLGKVVTFTKKSEIRIGY